VNTDGELSTYTPAHFKVVPKAVRIFSPAPAERPGVAASSPGLTA